MIAPTLPTVTWPPRMTARVADAPDEADPARASTAREASTKAEWTAVDTSAGDEVGEGGPAAAAARARGDIGVPPLGRRDSGDPPLGRGDDAGPAAASASALFRLGGSRRCRCTAAMSTAAAVAAATAPPGPCPRVTVTAAKSSAGRSTTAWRSREPIRRSEWSSPARTATPAACRRGSEAGGTPA